jgi:hypothetical protein
VIGQAQEIVVRRGALLRLHHPSSIARSIVGFVVHGASPADPAEGAREGRPG